MTFADFLSSPHFIAFILALFYMEVLLQSGSFYFYKMKALYLCVIGQKGVGLFFNLTV